MVLDQWYVPVPVTRCTLVENRYTYAPPLGKTSSTSGLLFSSPCLRGDLCANPVLDGVGMAGFQSRANVFLLA